MKDVNNLVWIDLEMTGLDPEINRVIEVATIVTDGQLNVLAEGPVIAIYQPAEIIDNLDEWNRTHHGQSGLLDRVRQSPFNEADAQAQTIAFLTQFIDAGISPMCGNSVHQDRRFLAKYLPKLERFFHYRNLDVSTVKELAHRWYGKQAHYEKRNTHQALEDIRESIGELQFYRKTIFKDMI